MASTRDIGLGAPLWGCPYTLTFPVTDRYGNVQTGLASAADSEVSRDGGTFADCTNEVAEIGTTGWYTITLLAAETQASTVAYKLSAGGYGYAITLYCVRCAVVKTGTAAAGAAAALTLAAGTVFSDHQYDGYILSLTGGTGSGQAARVINSVGSTRVLTVQANWLTQPDATTTYELLMPPERAASADDDLREVHARACYGFVTDVSDGTVQVYDGPDPATSALLFTLTKSEDGDQSTWVRS